MTYLTAALGLWVLLTTLWIFQESRRPGSLIQPTDWLTGDRGRLSGAKSFDFFAFVVTTWVVVVMVISGNASVTLIGVYASIWTTRSAINKFQNLQEAQAGVSAPAVTTTTTTAPADATVSTQVTPNVGG